MVSGLGAKRQKCPICQASVFGDLQIHVNLCSMLSQGRKRRRSAKHGEVVPQNASLASAEEGVGPDTGMKKQRRKGGSTPGEETEAVGGEEENEQRPRDQEKKAAVEVGANGKDEADGQPAKRSRNDGSFRKVI